MKRFLFRSLILSSALLTAACGSEGSGDDDDDGGGTQMDSATAQRAGGRIANGAESGAKQFDIRSSSSFACDETTTLPDMDGDGIPDMVAIEHTAPCSKMTPWGFGTVDGNEVITDDAGAGASYSILSSLEISVGSGTAGILVSYDNATQAEKVGDVFELAEATDLEISGNDENGPYSETHEIAWAKVYAPQSAWAPGDAAVAGTLEYAGAFVLTFETGLGTTIVQAAVETATPLTLDPACPTLVVAGSLDAVVGDGSNAQVLHIVWTGCDAAGTELIQD